MHLSHTVQQNYFIAKKCITNDISEETVFLILKMLRAK